jgi:putative CocE/NonD family hydrolase
MRIVASLATVLLVARASAQTAEPKIIVEKNVEAKMRDAVVLRADVYRPDVPEKLPALLECTPYSKSTRSDNNQFRRLAAAGYVVVIQDTRGRYMSDGIAIPHDEGADGYDTIEWVAALPHVNGRVGTFGGSYAATTQLLAAPLRPPHLVAIFPSSSYSSRYDMVFQGGAFYLADGLSWNLGQGADVRRRMTTPEVDRDNPIGMTPEERQRFNAEWLLHVPLKTIDAMNIRQYAPGYFAMLEHPSYDAFWTTFDVEAKHGDFEVPAFHVTGWYDALSNGTIRNFTGLTKNARTERACDNQHLLIGPWTHSTPTLRSTSIGGSDFGPNGGFDAERLMLDWFDYWLKDKPNGVTSRAPVRLFVMGRNVWRDEPRWPLYDAAPTPFYLHSGGNAATAKGDGTLTPEKPGRESADHFSYDPANPVSTGARGGYSRSPSDQRDVEVRPDVLVYSSAPIEIPLEATGPITVTLWASSSEADTDFTAKLVDVFPDGTARALTDGILRARYRNSKTTPQLLVPNRPVELTIDVGATSNVFLPGHRIRVEISSSNFPRFDRNPNTGGRFGEDAELRVARQTILHDAEHPSRIVLPVVRR